MLTYARPLTCYKADTQIDECKPIDNPGWELRIIKCYLERSKLTFEQTKDKFNVPVKPYN